MKNYINNARSGAIITLNIEAIGDPEKSLLIAEPGAEDVVTPCVLKVVGYHDIYVGPGKELRVPQGTTATFIAVRSSS